MNIELDRNGICLKPKQLLRVRGGRGHAVRCDRGSVWVTQEGDTRDIVLSAGESFTLDREGVTLVLAFEPGAISIARAGPQSRAARLAALLKRALPGAGLARGAVGF